MLGKALEVLQQAVATGRIADGKIFVFEIEKTIRIRTGEINNDAL